MMFAARVHRRAFRWSVYLTVRELVAQRHALSLALPCGGAAQNRASTFVYKPSPAGFLKSCDSFNDF